MPSQKPDETTAHYLYRLLYEKNLGTDELVGALEEEDLQASDFMIAAANERKRHKEDLTVDFPFEAFKERLPDNESIEDMTGEDLRSFVQGILDSEGFQTILMQEAEYWLLREVNDH